MTGALTETEAAAEPDQIDWLRNLPFILLQLGCLAVFWTGVSEFALAVGAVTLAARMFGLTAGYHRYFCHRAFKTSRVFQFVLAWLGASAAQRGPLWWAGHHRWHHRHSDTAEDVHPPGVRGILWAHAGWIMSKRNDRTRIEWIRDFAAYRELRWLDANHYVAPVSLGVALFLLGAWLAAAYPALGTNGPQLVVVGLLCSTTLLYHCTFAVNSIGHTVGSRRYVTRDNSRNSFWLALVTAGEGWHNNHHRYPASERQGFYWWEIDLTHYGVVLLSWLRLVWDVRGPSADVLREGNRQG
ncbi:MAG: acyl-CoA desaturase [Acidobacteria bacterium]|nr:acyl-CoA desaturase [Acidobacteriota bacterium]MYD71444.1 acyl-CoA desaturase [Acidobacteriota bacterium]MYJ05076.1 acyl-CoA desaturase [Acidobacteriota bacterium]